MRSHLTHQTWFFTLFAVNSALLLLASNTYAAEADPFAGDFVLSNSAEIVLTHTRMPHFIDGTRQEVPDHLSRLFDAQGFGQLTNIDNELITGDGAIEAGATGNQRGHDLVVDDFNGDDFDNVASAWEGLNGDLVVRLSEVNNTSLNWLPARTTTFPGALTTSACGGLTNHRLVSARLDDDEERELVVAYWANDGALTISANDVDAQLELSLLATASDIELRETNLRCGASRFDIAAGDFDGDGRDELIVVSVQGEPGDLRWQLSLQVYSYNETNQTLTARANTLIHDPFAAQGNDYDLQRLTIAAGDLTGDLSDEVAIAYTMTEGDEPTLIHAYAFSVSPDLTVINAENPTSNAPGFFRIASSRGESPRSMAAMTKDINQDGRHELFIASRSEVRIFDATLTPDPNPDDEIDHPKEPVLRSLTTVGRRSANNSDNVRPFDIADMNAETALDSEDTSEDATTIAAPNNGLWRYELVTVEEDGRDNDSDPDYNQLNVRVHEIRSIPGLVRSEEIVNLIQQNSGVGEDRIEGRFDINRRTAIALGDFDRDSVRLGKPRRSMHTDVVRPLVVLNAPPIHYDLLNDQNCPGGICDVASCFGGQSCDFVATHERLQERSFDVSTQVTADWSVSRELEVGLEARFLGLGLKVSERLKSNVGEQFSKSTRYTRTVSVEDRQTAIVDDFINAMVADYEIWEYPVYAGGDIKGWVVAVVPGVTQPRWFDSKSYSAASHIPAHEVGNILSYQSLNNPEQNNTFAEGVRFETGDGRTLGAFANSSWKLTQQTGEETTRSRRVSTSVEGTPNGLSLSEKLHGIETPFISDNVGALERIPGVSFAGSGESTEGDYSTARLTLSTSTMTDKQGLGADFGPIDFTLGNVRYTVTPYVYWAKNGALVLDYAVEPESASAGNALTFWDTHYGSTQTNPGKIDPAFILPWRYDPEKGFPLSEPAQRFRTKDITFLPRDPEPGDNVTIVARIHNWSLVGSNTPFNVRFYNGNPNEGGELIVSPGGDTQVLTTDAGDFPAGLEPRGRAFAKIDWTVPNTTESFHRIYVQIDAGNAVDEIHESNNLGWAVLRPVGMPQPPSPLAASLLPASRSTQVDTTITAFATIINSGTGDATDCAITPLTMVPGTFSYQITDPATNAAIGQPNTPIDIASGASQTYVFAITPTTAFAPADVQIGFDCTNTERALPISGVNTLLLSSSSTPVPDIVALGQTATGDGIVRIPGASANGAFAVATVNVAASASITATADSSGTALPVVVNVCQTDPLSGQCINPTVPGASATVQINSDETPTFAVFASSMGEVPLDPAKNRIIVRFKDGNGVVRGSTSVAVTTQP